MQNSNNKDIFVTNPETGEVHNCSNIVANLYMIYKNYNSKFKDYIDILESCIGWDDTLEKQIDKLKEVLSRSKLGDEFKKQLDKVILYTLRENETYTSISENYADLYNKRQKEKGISFLCPDLDKCTGGIMPGTICTIVGGPGTMKTTLAVNIAYQAVKDGKNVCYCSFEETTFQLYSKLLSRVTYDMPKHLSFNSITKQELETEDKKYLLEDVLTYLSNLEGKFHMLGDKDFISYEFQDLERTFKIVDKKIKKERGDDHGIDLIIVDHLQILKYALNEKDEYRVMNSYVSFFRKLSLSFLNQEREISVILLSQVNREGIAYAQKHKGAYLMQHVAEASELERASTYIISTYSDKTSPVNNMIKVGALKLRNSPLPPETINVGTDGEFYKVGEKLVPEMENYIIYDNKTSLSNENTILEKDSLMQEVLSNL